MSTFDILQDAPGLLRSEALNITLTFDRTGPNTGRISWNIPRPAVGCGSLSQAYCGILVTIDTTPINSSKIPTNGTVYSSDPTVDQNLFAGDKLGTALIVGAFYEDKDTTFVDISGLQPNTPYYVSGFPMDCQYRFHIEGVHAYSLDYTNKGSNGTTGDQRVLLNNQLGVKLSDYTGLQPSIDYEFSVQIGLIPSPKNPINPYECNPIPRTYQIHVDGTNSTTYENLINEINKQFSLLDNPFQSSVPPNTGSLYMSPQNQLFTWNGYDLVPSPTITQTTDPCLVYPGTYWYNGTELMIRNDINGWNEVSVLTSPFDPLNPVAYTSYWLNGTQGYVWNGAAWCVVDTIIQTNNPSLATIVEPGSYWFNTQLQQLYSWDNNIGIWTNTIAIQSAANPNNLPTGSFWFNTINNKLYARNIPEIGWNEQPNVAVSEKAPTTPAPGKFWFNPISNTLRTWRADLQDWEICTVIVYNTDPSIRESCDLWWDTLTNELHSWDTINNVWKSISRFYIQDKDPIIPIELSYRTMWYNPDTNTVSVWLNNCFVTADVLITDVDITNIPIGQIWHNTTNDDWNKFDGDGWASLYPIVSSLDPSNLPINSLWYNPSTSTLQMWNGMWWVVLSYTNTNPAPQKDTLWFNTDNNTLLSWTGTSWTVSDPKARIELDCNGNLLITDTSVGSLSYIAVTDYTLFKSLSVPYRFGDNNPGTDGVSNQPSYNELGVGTDGSDEARSLLSNQIRYELGYPVVDVELTAEQLDYAITKALSELRSKSGLGYKHGFFFLYTKPETSKYLLTNKIGGLNKIVDVLSIQRVNSLASGGHDSGIYGQIFANFLYNAGNFDLLSYHLMTEYKKTYEILFAQRIQYNWSEQTRELYIHQRMPSSMLLSIEATVERTEQDIMSDRYCVPWVRRYATALARIMLAEIRGKYSTLPGAGGGITLNANDLRMAAKDELEACLNEIDNFLVDNPSEWGMSSSFLFG